MTAPILKDPVSPASVLVLGAGMVGVSCAWALRRRGFEVTLVDAQEPGRGTSGGNAGMLAASSFIPFNNPKLWPQLPQLLSNRSAKLRFVPAYVLSRAARLAQFLGHGRDSDFQPTTQALNALIQRSRALHLDWMRQAGCEDLRRDLGWLMLYRSAQARLGAAWTTQLYQAFGVAHQTLSAGELLALEPAIRPGAFESALWVQDASSVSDPGALVRAYAQAFVAIGGQIQRQSVKRLLPTQGGWRAETDRGALQAHQAVLALGPWSDTLLQPLGLRLPLIHERGQHQHLAYGVSHRLSRPVNDTGGAYVLSPMAGAYRLTTGVELNAQLAPVSAGGQAQLVQALHAVREAIEVGEPLPDPAWLGTRPTLPDSRPMIGPAPRQPGLWLALGHQHIGLSTGPASGEMLAQMMSGDTTSVDAAAFRPDRFRL
ncbi:MAG: FAD-binding oxidoreductase [Alphaproteobacteria bacterium]|nr:FAD-binding oxidoreductase [Alphaproteobacteria bacterium]